ncbi:MAG: 4Fe-4S dicluster domain-containing protein [Candidatus Hadarchaeales archaeon]
MRESLFLPRRNLPRALKKLAETSTLYAPVKTWEGVTLEPVRGETERVTFEKRLPSVKPLFLPPVEGLIKYSMNPLSLESTFWESPFILLGARACDLNALVILDKVFLEEPVDEHYRRRREAATLISLDCLEPEEACFCTRLGYHPYPTSGFDLNMSQLEEGMLLEAGSEKGSKILQLLTEFTENTTPAMLEERERNRKRIEGKMEGRKLERLEKVGELKEEYWKRYALKCVECSACINICPTCYCFSLAEEKLQEHFLRLRYWEPCLKEGYQKVAAGVNPRPELHSRLANRILHKFAYFPEKYGTYACTGCGRCVEACLGKIDVREPLEHE